MTVAVVRQVRSILFRWKRERCFFCQVFGSGQVFAQTGNGTLQFFTAQAEGNITAGALDNGADDVCLAAQSIGDGIRIIHRYEDGVYIIHVTQQAFSLSGIILTFR